MIAVVDDVDLARDRDLVLRAQAGHDDAFAQLYSRYHRRLIRFASKRVGDLGDAEEIAQETFARAYRALPSFGGERRFYPWLTVIASRLCIDWLRRTSRVEVGQVADAATIDVDFDRLERELDAAHIGEAMGKLCDRHREVLELREHEGWSYQQIADHYKVSLGTVEALIWRARRALRREYEGLGTALLGVPLLRRLLPINFGNPARAVSAISTIGTVAALGLTGVAVSTPPAAVASVAPLVAAASAVPARSAATVVTAAGTVAPTALVAGHQTTSQPQGANRVAAQTPALEFLLATQPARQAVDADPVHVDLGVVALGLNPANIPQSVQRTVDTVNKMLHNLEVGR
jgi:RNA polymerase sigma factor (sigma-70 family)